MPQPLKYTRCYTYTITLTPVCTCTCMYRPSRYSNRPSDLNATATKVQSMLCLHENTLTPVCMYRPSRYSSRPSDLNATATKVQLMLCLHENTLTPVCMYRPSRYSNHPSDLNATATKVHSMLCLHENTLTPVCMYRPSRYSNRSFEVASQNLAPSRSGNPYTPYSARMSPESTHKLMGFYTIVFNTRRNTLVYDFCFFKLFPIGCIGLTNLLCSGTCYQPHRKTNRTITCSQKNLTWCRWMLVDSHHAHTSCCGSVISWRIA